MPRLSSSQLEGAGLTVPRTNVNRASRARQSGVTAAALFAAIVAAACADQRHGSDEIRTIPAFTYLSEIEPLLADRCSSCHGGAEPAGQYSVESWRSLLGPGSDELTRNAIAGDANSLLLTKLGDGSDAVHGNVLELGQLDTLRAWIVDDGLAYADSGYHPPNWLYPGRRDALDFHGGALRAAGWDTSGCESCHGADLRGGPSDKSCYACHAQGVEGCDTCHGASGAPFPVPDLSWGLDPRASRGVGAHRAHRDTKLFAPIPCSSCHVVPNALDAPGHLFDDAERRTSDLRAEVSFEREPRGSLARVEARYDRENGSCTVYCHGPSLAEPRPDTTTPAWTGDLPCAGCHPVPMAQFGGPDCSVCHPQSVERCDPAEDVDGCLRTGDGVGVRFLDVALHGDGSAVLGKAGAERTCHACHGTAASSGAPAPDLRGRQEETWITVGLHAAHLTGARFRAPLPCSTCHRVPREPTDAGHFDDDLPAEVTFDDVAKGATAEGATARAPSWDRETATCSNTHCHSLGGGQVSEWRWTRALGAELDCDACHGMPPNRLTGGGIHTRSTNCSASGCHAQAYAGAQLDPSRHINGTVEVGP